MGTSQNDYLSALGGTGGASATLNGGGGNNTLIGGHDSADSLYGVGDGSDSFNGGLTGGGFYNPNKSDITSAANDTIVGSSATGALSNFILTGGNSLAAANFSGVNANYTLTGDGTNMTLTAPGGTSVTNVDFIGNAVLGNGNNLINFANERANHNVWVGSGNDTFVAGFGDSNFYGGSGNDSLQVNWSGNNYSGGNGAPAAGMKLAATYASNTGFSGNASAYYASLAGSQDLLNFSGMRSLNIMGTSQNDYLSALGGTGGASATLNGGGGNNTLVCGANNYLVGGSGNDSLAGTSNDTMMGGGGNNTYVVTSASNLISDQGTVSTILSTVALSLSSSLISGVNNLVYNGMASASITGNSHSDSLLARFGNDTLSGCPTGSHPGVGKIDTLTGGVGADLYVLGSQANGIFYNGGGGVAGKQDYALINSFIVAQDRLQLSGNSSQYFLGSSPITSGQGLYYDSNLNHRQDASDELIGVLLSGNGTPLTAANTINRALFV
jgi:Ca2+-binding RTX toxin-like protein